MDLFKLSEPFKYEDLEFRISRSGANNGNIWAVALTYITARAIHDRLDEVCGPDKWQMRYKEHHNGTICEIGIKIDNEWVWKAGGSDSTQIEAFKGGLSGAEKRAGVPWGIGRYLYKLSRYPDLYVNISTTKNKDWNYQGANRSKNIPAFYWENPKLPDEFIAGGKKTQQQYAYELDLKLTEKDMTDNEKAQIAKFYCNQCGIDVCEIKDMSINDLEDFISKVDLVFDAFINSIN